MQRACITRDLPARGRDVLQLQQVHRTALSRGNAFHTFIRATLLFCIFREASKRREIQCTLPPYHLIICHKGQDGFKLILLAHFLANFWVCICLEAGMNWSAHQSSETAAAESSRQASCSWISVAPAQPPYKATKARAQTAPNPPPWRFCIKANS